MSTSLGHAFKELGQKRKTTPRPQSSRSRGVKTTLPRSLNYARIKIEVMAAIAELPADKQAMIPMAGTLPEIMVAWALVKLGIYFTTQVSELGGHMRLGGAAVDFVVGMGMDKVAVRVNGDYWHSIPSRKLKDAVQYERLHALHYRVCDIWESAIYQAWVDGSLKQVVQEGILGAV
jgi:hypothetical protein